jgi:hypothetical protein
MRYTEDLTNIQYSTEWISISSLDVTCDEKIMRPVAAGDRASLGFMLGMLHASSFVM